MPYVVTRQGNVINVLYVEETYGITVNYYKDSVTNPGDSNFLGSASFADEYTAGSTITLAGGTAATQLDYLKPEGYQSGVQQGAVPYVVTRQGNVINVLYIELEDIPDEEPPLSPPTEEIPDEDIPLTGDARTGLWGFMMAAAVCGAGTIALKKKIRG